MGKEVKKKDGENSTSGSNAFTDRRVATRTKLGKSGPLIRFGISSGCRTRRPHFPRFDARIRLALELFSISLCTLAILSNSPRVHALYAYDRYQRSVLRFFP